MVKVRGNHVVQSKPAYLAAGIDTDGEKHVLGIWLAKTPLETATAGEGARFWASVTADLRNRGVTDILIACCDGLNGSGDAIHAAFPHTVVQTCVVHYPDTVVMPIPGGPALAGGGDRGRDIGIITGLRGRREGGRAAGSGPAGSRGAWSGRVLAA